MTKITATRYEEIFVYGSIIPYGIPKFMLTDNGPQFVSKLFTAVCAFLVISQLTTTTTYYPQTNLKTDLYNATLISRLRNYLNDYQTDWD